MKTAARNAFAKINLFLAATGVESNGYHTIETVFQAISLHDTVSVVLDPDTPFSVILDCSDATLPCDSRNIAYRAAIAFTEKFPVPGGISVRIEKNIPVAGGLAGGSTDAAAVLLCLNDLCGFPLSEEELCTLGAALGADVPFCILADSGHPCAQGFHYGEKLISLPSMPDCTVLVSAGSEEVSTVWAYRELDRNPYDKPCCSQRMADAVRNQDISAVFGCLCNRFEDVILPQRPGAEARRAFLRSAADASLMSGSGPTVLGFFSGTEADSRAELAAMTLSLRGARTWICHPIR